MQQAKLIYCEEGCCHFQQDEADTMISSAYAKLRKSYNGTVIIDSEDTDVYVQAACIAHDLPGDLLIKNKNTLFKCTDLVSSNIANVLIPFHVITGCDHTSGFYGHGKKSVFEKLQKDQEAQHLLQKVGNCLELSDDVRDDMRQFVLLKIYGGKETNCAEARAAIWRKMKKKSLVPLPPDEDILHHHLDQVNYLPFFLKHYELNRHPSQIGRGWEYINRKCRPF